MKRRLAVLTAVTLAVSLAGCSDDDKKPAAQGPAPSASPSEIDESKPPLPEIPGATARPGADPVAATGFGAFQIGTARADLDADGMVESPKDTGDDCVTATGAAVFNPPSLVFAQGKLAQVRVTGGTGTPIGQSLAQVQAAYPGGAVLTGTGGATGWAVPSGANTLLLEITADKVTAMTAGTTETVTKVFTTGQGC
ncbi:hypothetical protein [Actinoplanes sp. L3-i22]|uniref:hypothetical protein n=1 Tax=Actinoplanes sp. L3-i22 TaxID=2836373 RepID=UPI001C73FFA0|nr:hypothetical protein [Actinoplanes sp. L3-i22]BCY15238.1 hypothetical protein L3i22_103260 [Actinoplanes sp. L3-i22]